ncbi:hypothetical protein TRFO_03846 [Tritrichomonas foetus]|uniref:Uncharacterized protein n=1 Tax=Tritrichomonas foetus TaxID=1144522 RepID=A0A1J4KK87_9EUKA|nr:hypothetical protein TRFO_03846 [Tritrichomonas foetus]|eukprot:OHT11643.1 hypothetical protein TRFO_03846 [Tritrichomonas foetus]
MSTKGAVAYNFVLLKVKGKNGPGKKALIPPTLAALRKNASRILNFPDDKPVRSLYDEQMQLIKNISDIVPNTTVYVSSEVTDDEMTSGAQITQNISTSPSGRVPRSVSPTTSSPTVRISQNDSKAGGMVSIASKPGNLSPTQGNLSQLQLTSSGLRSSLTSRPVSTLNTTGGLRPPSTLQSRPGSRSPSSLMIVVNDENGGSGMPRARRRANNDDFGLDDADQFESEDNDTKRFAQTGISHRALEKLLAFLPAELTLAGEGLEAIIEQLSPVVARFGSHAQKLQAAQEAYIYKHIGQRLREIPKHSSLIDERAVELVNAATFGTSCGATTHFRGVVVGPSKCGKSLFLQVLANVTLLRMVSSGQYKRTLFFNFDFNDFAEEAQNPLLFYNKFVKLVFEQISNQRLDFAPFLDSIVSYFQRIPKLDKLPVLPQKFTVVDEFRGATAVLQEIAQNVFDCVNEVRSLSVFLTLTVMLPRYCALAFGFSGVHFVIDHVDASDFDITPEAPFDADPLVVTFIEHIKFMLSNDSFVISGTNSEKLVDALDLITDDGVDLRDGTEIIPVTDLDDGHSNAFEFALTVDGLTHPAKLRLIDCGGCSGYLIKWDEIIEQARLLNLEENKDRNARSAKECRLALLAKLRELAPLVLVTINPDDQTASPLTGTIRDFVINQIDTDEEQSD